MRKDSITLLNPLVLILVVTSFSMTETKYGTALAMEVILMWTEMCFMDLQSSLFIVINIWNGNIFNLRVLSHCPTKARTGIDREVSREQRPEWFSTITKGINNATNSFRRIPADKYKSYKSPLDAETLMIKLKIGTQEITVPKGTKISHIKEPFQKLIFRGKILNDDFEIMEPMKLFLVQQNQQDIQNLNEQEEKYKNIQRTYQQIVVKPKYEPKREYNIKVLELPSADRARDILYRIWDDVGIRQIMSKRNWKLGQLIELHPNERAILGYNRNKGEVIALRLRTDDLTGFRYFDSIVKVMLHELAHFEHSAHDEQFHRLNRELNREYELFKGKSLGPTPPQLNQDTTTRSMVLGGSQPKGNMRQVLLNAALSRLSKEEQEITDSCDNKHPH